MNVYDFDETIYRGNATVDFYLFCLKRQPGLLRFVPRQLAAFLRVKANVKDLTAAKEGFYAFLPALKNPDVAVLAFWDEFMSKIAPWYLAQKQSGDLVISASPEFLLTPCCKRLGISCLASKVDLYTGRYEGKNCAGEEKVRRFHEAFPSASIGRFYSDSLSDGPLAALADAGFFVRRGRIRPWPKGGKTR